MSDDYYVPNPISEVGSTPQEGLYPSESHKKHWIVLGAFLFLIAITAIIILLVIKPFSNISSENLSDMELLEGSVVNIKENNSVGFKVGEEDHNIGINFIGLDYVDITIQSEPIELRLKLNETKEIDLDNDGNYDIRIRLEGIKNGIPEIFIKRVNNPITCSESWNCTSWTSCIEGTQSRECTDSNNCGTKNNKPLEEQTCDNDENEKHSPECTDNANCTQTCTYCERGTYMCVYSPTNPDINQTCVECLTGFGCVEGYKCEDYICISEEQSENTQETINCGIFDFNSGITSQMDCLIEAAETCQPAKVITKTYLEFFSLSKMNYTELKEIRGLKDGKCEYYTITQEYYFSYTEEAKESLMEQNYTLGEIEEMEEEQEEIAIGTNDTCLFEISDLVSLLEKQKDGNFSSSDWDSAECEYNTHGSTTLTTN